MCVSKSTSIRTVFCSDATRRYREWYWGATVAPLRRYAPAKAGGEAASAPRRASAKERVESIGQAARTLEKLLELKRLERLAVEGGDADAAETARLREEFLSRLRSLDARRREGATLFDADGAYAGDPRPVDDGPAGPSAAMDGA